MAVEPLRTWKDQLEALPKSSDLSWTTAFAGWYADMIANIEPDPSVFTDPTFSFTFPKTIFSTALATLPPTTDAIAGVSGFADAWESAINASIIVSNPGAYLGSATPATTFSTFLPPPPFIIDPASVALGKAKLLELTSSEPVSDPQESEFPEKFREATLLLTFTVAGLDSTPSPSGPLPIPPTPVPLT